MPKSKQAGPDNSILLEDIETYLSKAKLRIIKLLTTKYNIKEKMASKMADAIDASTRAKMRQYYTYKDPFLTTIKPDEIEVFNRFNYKYPDCVNWYIITTNIIFYQSLGDTIGYNNGKWEFNYGDADVGPEYCNELIYEFISLGGVNDLSIKNWLASDDTVLYMATMTTLTDIMINDPRIDPTAQMNDFGLRIKNAYLETKKLIVNRDPGQTTMNGLEMQETIEWDKLPYNRKSIGAGSAMRSGCIGIFFPGKYNRDKLIALAVESSRITHNSATAILGSVVAALFTAYALERVAINRWPHKLLKLLKSKMVNNYMEKSRPKEYPLFVQDKVIYIGQWEKYISLLFSGINPRMDIKFMKNPVQRYEYLAENFSRGCGTPGGCGDDALIMAYDSLLRSEGVFEKLIVYSILHPGDSDTVGSIAFSWFGALYHSPRNTSLIGSRFEDLEFFDQLFNLQDTNFTTMVHVYYTDIYMNIALKYLKKLVANN